MLVKIRDGPGLQRRSLANGSMDLAHPRAIDDHNYLEVLFSSAGSLPYRV